MTTKEKIKQNTMKLYLDKGIEGTSIKDILEASEVSTGSLYHHFPSKEDIAKEIYFDIHQELLSQADSSLENQVQFKSFLFSTWKQQIKWYMDNPDKRMFMETFSNSPYIKENHTPENVDERFVKINERINEALEANILDKEVLDFNFVNYTFYAYINSIVSLMTDDSTKNNATFIEMSFNKYWRSIAYY